jgi:peptidase E
LAQDVIYVGGGSLISLLGVWRAHGIDSMLKEAHEAGVILCGLSAGSLCWFAEALSGYHDEVNRVPPLGFLPHSNAVHYGNGERRGAFHRHLLDGMPAGYAAEDGAALRFVGSELVEVVASRPEARAYKLERRGSHILETRLATRYLGAEAPATVIPLPRQAAA